MGFLDKLAKAVQNVYKSAETVGTQTYRKAKKPFRQYMASERAEKVLDKQLKVPRRAPMNISKMEFTKEKIEATKSEVHEMMQKKEELVKNMERMKIISSDPSSSDLSETQHPKPQSRTYQPLSFSDVPRGLLSLSDMIELLHNHNLQPDEWTTEELAEHFKLRASDVKDLLENFRLITPEERIKR